MPGLYPLFRIESATNFSSVHCVRFSRKPSSGRCGEIPSLSFPSTRSCPSRVFYINCGYAGDAKKLSPASWIVSLASNIYRLCCSSNACPSVWGTDIRWGILRSFSTSIPEFIGNIAHRIVGLLRLITSLDLSAILNEFSCAVFPFGLVHPPSTGLKVRQSWCRAKSCANLETHDHLCDQNHSLFLAPDVRKAQHKQIVSFVACPFHKELGIFQFWTPNPSPDFPPSSQASPKYFHECKCCIAETYIKSAS